MEDAPDSIIGRTIAGKYTVEQRIGSGAMGVVYRARQIDLDKRVAVKILHRTLQKDRERVALFKREAKAASRLDHPSSVRVFDFGAESDGSLYLVMEYVAGEDLFALQERAFPMPASRVADLLSQVLAALSLAHEMGVIHRDLKPENILVVPGKDDEGRAIDVVKVCDFGIAKILDQQDGNSTGVGLGTPQYMAPEQARGEVLDPRADLYAIGVILYELVAGRPPFTAENALALALKHVTDEPAPPSAVRPDVDSRLERIALKALAKKREDRFQSAREMRAALRAVVDGDLSAPVALGGRYLIGPTIGSGGMARVHLGRLVGSEGFSRVVAIKRLLPQLAADEVFVRSFMDEARLASRVRHQNVVPTLDVAREGKEVLLVMEYVPGESLATLIGLSRTERIPPKIACAILCDALMGLHAAHEATDELGRPLDLVHRDVSAENVLVGTDGVGRVLDFGVAKASGRRQITQDGAIKGKLAYFAPEHALRAPITRRADIFAAGLVAWETLTGRRVRDRRVATSEELLFTRVDPPTRHAPELPAAVDAVVAKATARDPRDRFASAREMAVALDASIGSAPRWEVGEWVGRVAAARLAERTELALALEGSRESREPKSLSGPRADPRLETLTDASLHVVRAPRARIRWWQGVAALAAIVALGFGIAIVATRDRPSPIAPSSTPRVATSSSVEARVELRDPVPVPPPAISAPAPSAMPSIRARPIRSSKPAETQRPRNCDPPWIDDAGIRIPKPECF